MRTQPQFIKARGNMLVSGSGDRTLRLWQLDSGACIATLEGHGDAVTCLTLAGESGDRDRLIIQEICFAYL